LPILHSSPVHHDIQSYKLERGGKTEPLVSTHYFIGT